MLYTIGSLTEKSRTTKLIADRIIEEYQLSAILSKFGHIYFTGSYAADVMINRDIDLYVVKFSDFYIDEILDAHNEIFKTK